MNMKEYYAWAVGAMLAVGIVAIAGADDETGKSAQSDSRKYTLENVVNRFSMDGIEETPAGYQYWFIGKEFLDGRTVKMSVVDPGKATHEPHSHIEDEVFFVLEGTAEFYLDGQTTTAGPYTSFYCPSGSKHGIRNAGDTVLKYLVIKKYNMK